MKETNNAIEVLLEKLKYRRIENSAKKFNRIQLVFKTNLTYEWYFIKFKKINITHTSRFSFNYS